MTVSQENQVPHETQPLCDRRFDDLERRLELLEKAEWRSELKDLAKAVGDLKEQLANLNGRMIGYLAAAGVLAAILSGLVQFVLRK